MKAPRDWGRPFSNIPLAEQHLAGIAAGEILQRMVPLRLGQAPGPPSLVLRVAGGAAVAAGSGAITWAWFAARGARLAQPDALATAGPYAFSRNPMYVGWALVHLGVGLLRNDAWTVAALAVASAAVHRGVLREEALLEAAFPADFSRYRLSVPRYLPHLHAGLPAVQPLRPRH